MTGGVVGFDIGNLNCVICQAKRGSIDTVLNESSKRQTPNLVSFQGKQRFRGDAAAPIARANFKNTIQQMKRLIGRNWSEPEVQYEIQNFMPNSDNFVCLEGDRIGIKVEYNDETYVFTAEEAMAMVLAQLSEIVYKNDGIHATDVVLSCPGYWNDKQRRALIEASKLAGIHPLNLLNDHTATALSYGIYKSARNMFDATQNQYVMFIDMGHANLSVAIVAFIQGKLQVISAAYDRNLGGRDFDLQIMKHFAEEFKAKHKLDVLSNPKGVMKLLDACEKAKQILTPEGVAFAKVTVEFLMNELDFNSELTLEKFDEISAPLVDRIEAPIMKCLEESKITVQDLAHIEIIGGGTRPRCVKRRIAEVLKLDMSKPSYGLSTTLNADEAVARGCALNSAMLSPQFRVKEFSIGDIVNYSIRLSWEQKDEVQISQPAVNDQMELEEDAETALDRNSIVIMQRGTETPKTRRVTFRRREPFEVIATYDEDSMKMLPKGTGMQLLSCRISGMPNNPSEEAPKIRVNVRYAKDGTFSVISAQMLEEVVGKEATTDGKKEEVEGKKSDDAKMDTNAEAPSENGKPEEKGEMKDDETEKKPKKKQYRRIELKVEEKVHGLFTPAEMREKMTRMQKFDEQDRLLEETAAARNELETYIYNKRALLTGAWKMFVTSEEADKFGSDLDKEETWLYDEGFDDTREEYKKRLAVLKEAGNRFEARFVQQEERPEAQKKLTSAINDYLAVVNSTEERFDHITEEERNRVRSVCSDTMKWLDTQCAGQESLPLTADPVLTSTMIHEELRKLHNVSNPIVNKRRPPPAPKPKEEKPAGREAEKNEEKGDEKMPDTTEEQETAKSDGKKEMKAEDMETELD